MTLSKDQKTALVSKLEQTREKEMDCDEFLSHLAEYSEPGEMPHDLRALMEHHMKICPECEEERKILQRALEATKE